MQFRQGGALRYMSKAWHSREVLAGMLQVHGPRTGGLPRALRRSCAGVLV